MRVTERHCDVYGYDIACAARTISWVQTSVYYPHLCPLHRSKDCELYKRGKVRVKMRSMHGDTNPRRRYQRDVRCCRGACVDNSRQISRDSRETWRQFDKLSDCRWLVMHEARQLLIRPMPSNRFLLRSNCITSDIHITPPQGMTTRLCTYIAVHTPHEACNSECSTLL